jgi:proteasome lid subunit RPN8/RPN11
MSIPFQLLVTEGFLNEMLNHAIEELPFECCGVLGGRFETRETEKIGVVSTVYKLENSLKSEIEFLSSAESMLNVVKELRQKGEEMLVVYHSHPVSFPKMSKKDLDMIDGTNLLHLIVGNVKTIPEFGLWWVNEQKKAIPCTFIIDNPWY